MLSDSPTSVPANASRYFSNSDTAQEQPAGMVGLDLSPTGHIYNKRHRQDLIKYDKSYFSTSRQHDGRHYVPTIDYFFQVLRHFESTPPTICDIGCGQGELVELLRAAGLEACGFDPVLRQPSQHLYPELWSPNDSRGDADLLIMRPVLSQIPEPWDFLARAATRHKLILLEFPRIEWIIENRMWSSINHDYCNYFTYADFEEQFDILDRGVFADGEWAWILLQLEPVPRDRGGDIAEKTHAHGLLRSLGQLLVERQKSATRLEAEGRPIILWGAAGKGVVAADALNRLGVPLLASVDVDKNKWGLFQEGSGLEVWAPEKLRYLVARGQPLSVVVVNPRHIEGVRQFLGGGVNVLAL